MRSAHDIITMFGSVEDDQRYTRLVDLFTDDAVYCDPFYGPQRGRAAIGEFMAEMERVIPPRGIYFAEWNTTAETTVGWSTWVMAVPTGDDEHRIPGQSVYRLRDGKVCFVADYVDSKVYTRMNPKGVPLLAAAATEPKGTDVGGTAATLVRRFWDLQESARYSELATLFALDAVFTDQVYGRFEGHAAVSEYLGRMENEMPSAGVRFSLVDHAGDDTVAWSQWTCHMPGGDVPGWTLHTVRDGLFTLDADYFDVVKARAASTP